MSSPQGPQDPRLNFEKFQNSGADEKTVIVHISTHLSVFFLVSYPYLSLSYGPLRIERIDTDGPSVASAESVCVCVTGA